MGERIREQLFFASLRLALWLCPARHQARFLDALDAFLVHDMGLIRSRPTPPEED